MSVFSLYEFNYKTSVANHCVNIIHNISLRQEFIRL